MHYLLATAVRTTFLGLVTLFLSADSAPIGDTPSRGILERAPASGKQPYDYTQPGYSDQASTAEQSTGTWLTAPYTYKGAGGGADHPQYTTGEGWDIWEIMASRINSKGKPVTTLVDKLGVDAQRNTIVVMDSWNDADPTSSQHKLKLRQVLTAVWKDKARKQLSELVFIRRENIHESNVRKSIDNAYKKMNAKKGTILEVKESGTAPGEQEAYHDLVTKNPFGAGAQRLLQENPEMQGRKILTFTLDTRMGSYSLKIQLGSSQQMAAAPAAGSYGYATGSGSYGGGYTQGGHGYHRV